MRPVRLTMDGFASFREPTVVDFTGAEYFALVGPTGAGKSTVIDAITFALTILCRSTINITFFSMCVSTAYYKLGRIDRLKESYGRLIVLQCVFVVSGRGMRAHRIINDFRKLTIGDTELFLWDVWQKGDYEMHKREWDYEGKDIKNDGLIYSLHKGLTLLLLLPYAAWTFDCARRLAVLHDDLDFYLGQKVDNIFRPAIQLGMPLLPAKALGLGYSYSLNSYFVKGFLHLVKLEGFNNGFDLLHEFADCEMLSPERTRFLSMWHAS